eukprot:7377619-Prymnesium_polylepis.1
MVRALLLLGLSARRQGLGRHRRCQQRLGVTIERLAHGQAELARCPRQVALGVRAVAELREALLEDAVEHGRREVLGRVELQGVEELPHGLRGRHRALARLPQLRLECARGDAVDVVHLVLVAARRRAHADE